MKNQFNKMISTLLCLTLILSMATNVVVLAQNESSDDDEFAISEPSISNKADYNSTLPTIEEPAEAASSTPIRPIPIFNSGINLYTLLHLTTLIVITP